MDIEFERGSCSPKARHPHNGYWAGDFSQTPPMSWEQLRLVMELVPRATLSGRPASI